MLYSKYLSYPLPFYATLINNPFLDLMVSANHDKVDGHWPIGELYYNISFYLQHRYLKFSSCLSILLRTLVLLHLEKKLRLSVFTSVREFKKILPNTFIYESILIKIYMNTNIINTQIFHLDKYDLKGHWKSQKVICLSGNLRKFFLTHSFMNRFDKKLYEC